MPGAVAAAAMLLPGAAQGALQDVQHGVRSTFRDWCAERTIYPREVAEMALAQSIGNKVEAAYRRGDLLDRRCQMMDDWASFCAMVERASNIVVPLRKSKSASA